MAILISVGVPSWMTDEEMRDFLCGELPDADIRCLDNPGNPDDIEMLIMSRLGEINFADYKNLKLVQKLGAGVEQFVGAANLADDVRVTRLKSDLPAFEIAEYCLAYILAGQRQLRKYFSDQAAHNWHQVAPKRSGEICVGVLGLGQIGGRTARMIHAVGIRVIGWSRNAKQIDGMECRHGNDALLPLLGECDYVASILPSTPETRGLIDAEKLAAMKPGAVLINAGRGDLIVDADLLAALETGPLAAAVLDVFNHEPLPDDHAFWDHPAITVTPHVSGWHIDDGLADVAENYRRLVTHQPLLHQVDRDSGY
jgi:glyoxylate/hydroxypyruvate reductase